MSQTRTGTTADFLKKRVEDFRTFSALLTTVVSDENKIKTLENQIAELNGHKAEIEQKMNGVGNTTYLFSQKDETFPENFFTLHYKDLLENDGEEFPIELTLLSVELASRFTRPESSTTGEQTTEIILNFKDTEGTPVSVTSEISRFKQIFEKPAKSFEIKGLVPSDIGKLTSFIKFEIGEQLSDEKHRKLFYLDEIEEVMKLLGL